MRNALKLLCLMGATLGATLGGPLVLPAAPAASQVLAAEQAAPNRAKPSAPTRPARRPPDRRAPAAAAAVLGGTAAAGASRDGAQPVASQSSADEPLPLPPAPAPPSPADLAATPRPAPPSPSTEVPAPPAVPAGMEALPQGGFRLRFADGADALPPAAAGTLAELGHRLAAGPAGRIVLISQASGPVADVSIARRLSLARGLAVKQALAAGGLAPTRIDLRPMGRTTDGADAVDVQPPVPAPAPAPASAPAPALAR